MRCGALYPICAALLSSAPVLAEETKTAGVEAPVSKSDLGEARRQARHTERMAQQAWLAADAESEETLATMFRFLAETVEERAAWGHVAKVAAKQAAVAREMQQAWAKLEKSRKPGHRGRAIPTQKDEALAPEVGIAFRESEGKEKARENAWNAWEAARSEQARLSEASTESAGQSSAEPFDPDVFLAEKPSVPSSPSPDVASKPTPAAPSIRWWCATNILNRSDQICRMTRKDCESMDSPPISHYMGCTEQEIVTLLQFSQVNGGRFLMAFPLLSQCERKRKALMKNKVDYHSFSKCYGSAISAP
jgi:hypothetical protein